MLSIIFRTFLDDINEDLLPNDRTGFRETKVWNTLYKFQQDAALGLINKLETYNGCILADSVGLGKTFTALAVIKNYELRNKSVLVLCPKKLADNWLTYNKNLTTNILAEDRLNYDVLTHTDLLRESGYSMGMPLDQVNWGNYDLLVIDEPHNFRNDEATQAQGEAETRYRPLLSRVIRSGVRTKVLMLSATPVNNRFVDLRNQLALAYEGESQKLTEKLKSGQTVEEIFRQAHRAFNEWQDLPLEERTPESIIDRLDFAFFELLDAVTIARSRRHITTHYDMAEIGQFIDAALEGDRDDRAHTKNAHQVAADRVSAYDPEQRSVKMPELGLERSPRGEHRADPGLKDRIAVDQLKDACLEPPAADRADLQPEPAQHPRVSRSRCRAGI